MKGALKSYLILFICVICVQLKSQDKTIDSLKLVLKNAKHDTIILKTLATLVEIAPDGVWQNYNDQLYAISSKKTPLQKNSHIRKLFYSALGNALNNKGYDAREKNKNDSAIIFQNESIKYYKLANDTGGIAQALHNLAAVYKNIGDLEKAALYNLQALEFETALKKYDLMAKTLNNIGLIYYGQGKISESIIYFYNSLKYREQENDSIGIANTFINLGLAYTSQEDKKKALEYYKKGLNIKLKNKKGCSSVYSNIASMYNKFKFKDSALYFFNKAYQSSITEKNQRNEMIALNGLGLCNLDIGNLNTALNYFNEGLKISESTDDKQAYGTLLNNLAKIHFKQNNFILANELANRSFKISKEIGYAENIKNSCGLLFQIYKQKNEFSKALEMYELYILMKDSINNVESRKNSVKSQYKYEYEKKAAADSVRVVEEKKVVAVQLKQEKTQRYALYGGLGLVGLFALFMVNRFRVTNKQKKLIEAQKKIVEHQKELVDEKQKEVLDSIRYAKRIQESLLPTETYIQKKLRN